MQRPFLHVFARLAILGLAVYGFGVICCGGFVSPYGLITEGVEIGAVMVVVLLALPLSYVFWRLRAEDDKRTVTAAAAGILVFTIMGGAWAFLWYGLLALAMWLMWPRGGDLHGLFLPGVFVPLLGALFLVKAVVLRYTKDPVAARTALVAAVAEMALLGGLFGLAMLLRW